MQLSRLKRGPTRATEAITAYGMARTRQGWVQWRCLHVRVADRLDQPPAARATKAVEEDALSRARGHGPSCSRLTLILGVLTAPGTAYYAPLPLSALPALLLTSSR